MKKILYFPGGFKPPHVGHFRVLEDSISKIEDLDFVFILIGNGKRDNIDKGISKQIWKIFINYFNSFPQERIRIIKCDESPISYLYHHIKRNIHLNNQHCFIQGQKDINSNRYQYGLKKYPNHFHPIFIPNQENCISSTKIRELINNREYDKFFNINNKLLSNEDILKYWEILIKNKNV